MFLNKIKPVKHASSVNDLCLVTLVENAHNVAIVLPVRRWLKYFWQVRAAKGANPRVVSILKNGYNLNKRPLTKNPLVKSEYANPVRNTYLQEVLDSFQNKQAMEVVVVQSSLAF